MNPTALAAAILFFFISHPANSGYLAASIIQKTADCSMCQTNCPPTSGQQESRMVTWFSHLHECSEAKSMAT